MGLVNNSPLRTFQSPTWHDFFFTLIGNADYIRVMHHIGGVVQLMKVDQTEYRYEQTGDEYRLQSWHNGVQKQVIDRVANRPAWLSEIVDVAAVGGAAHRPLASPPDVLIWFRTDDKHNLVEFVDLLKDQP